MAIWYKVEKTEQGINDFMDCNWGFHDFRIEQIKYELGQDVVEIFLGYDTRKEGVVLQFCGIQGIHIRTNFDYEADWLTEATLLLRDNGTFLWVAAEDVNLTEMDHMPCTWVECRQLNWAVTDGAGQPVEMPADRLNQVWHSYGKTTEKHFSFQEL